MSTMGFVMGFVFSSFSSPHHDVGEQLLLVVANVTSDTLKMPAFTLKAAKIQRRKVGSTSETWSESSRAGWEKSRHADVVRLQARERHALVSVSPKSAWERPILFVRNLTNKREPHARMGATLKNHGLHAHHAFQAKRMCSSPSRC